MAFDDYEWHGKKAPTNREPKLGIDGFLTAYDSMYEVLHKGYQLHIRKTRDLPIAPADLGPRSFWKIWLGKLGKKFEKLAQQR